MSETKSAPEPATKSATKVDQGEVQKIISGMTQTMKDTLTHTATGKSPSGKGHFPSRVRALFNRGLVTGTEQSPKLNALGTAVHNAIKKG